MDKHWTPDPAPEESKLDKYEARLQCSTGPWFLALTLSNYGLLGPTLTVGWPGFPGTFKNGSPMISRAP
jgi:hypothetical protein